MFFLLIVEIQPVDNLAEVKPKKHTQKPRGLCPSGSKPEVLEVQQEKPRIIGNKRKVSWGSMFEVFGDQEKIASSPHLAPKSVDQEEVVDQYIQKKLTGTRLYFLNIWLFNYAEKNLV